jgi:hypothetical protein
MTTNLESELIIACARTTPTAADLTDIARLLEGAIDWERLIELATAHNLAPLLYANLLRVGGAPPAELDRLRRHVQQGTQFNLRLVSELLRLLDLFSARGIEAVPYKGPVLAAEIYGDIGLREIGDLDIFIHKRDFARAKQVMLAAGYQPHPCQVDRPDAAYLRRHHDYPFIGVEHGMVVELQWGVMQVPFVFPLHFEAWWQDVVTARLFGRTICSLPPESLLLILCMHGAKHMWSRLSWVCDIAELLRAHPQIDWDTVLERARVAGCQRMLRLALLLAHDILGAGLPAYIAERAEADATARALACQVGRQIRQALPVAEPSQDETPFFYLRMMERMRDKCWLCLYCYRSLFHPQRVWRIYGFRLLKYLIGIGDGS